jgi:hypothetical protein
LGPGLPLTLASPSTPRAAVEVLFTPPLLFLIASVGGGIDVGTGVPFGAGVFGLDSLGLSPFELAATGSVLDVVETESFDGESSLTKGRTTDFSFKGDNFKVTIMVLFSLAPDDLRRGVEVAVAGLLVEAIVIMLCRLCEGFR